MKILLLPLLFPFVFASACTFEFNIGDDAIVGSGVIRTDDYAFDGAADAIDVGEIVDVVITIDPGASTTTVEMTGDDNVLDEIGVELNGRTIEIGAENYLSFDVETRPTAEIRMPMLSRIDAGGAARVTVDDVTGTSELVIDVGGGSTVNTQGELDRIEVRSSGGAIVRHVGPVTTADLDASGGARVELEQAVGTAVIDASGGATIRVNAASVSGSLSGGSRAIVPATSSTVDVDTSGGARLEIAEMG